MNHGKATRRQRVAPRASVLIESMRDIGYSLQTAVADVVDNSVTAGARTIELLADTHSAVPAIGILDNGIGMTEAELLEAMRPGTRSPLDSRAATDLGRFGLGLKTASFSQCRRLTVVTRRNSTTSCAVWDLDTVAASDEWFVEIPSLHATIPWVNKLNTNGTLVIWQKLDRLVNENAGDDRQNLVRQIDEMTSHVEFVFHRFLSGAAGARRIGISLNGRGLQPYDPFHSRHLATQFGQEESFMLDGQEIRIQPVTLPHHNKVSAAEWNRYAGREGYVKNQGFYLYRNRRLIVHGNWFGLAKQTELTKLTRVRIDIPNSLDAEWKIDVKKASAQPPAPVRERLRRIIDRIGASSRRIYTSRGKRLVTDSRLPVWTKTQSGNRILYGLNADHPVFAGFVAELDPDTRHEFLKLIDLVVSTLPIDALFADMSTIPENVVARPLEEEAFTQIIRSTYLVLRQRGIPRDTVELMMSSAEPFRSRWSNAKVVIEATEQKGTEE